LNSFLFSDNVGILSAGGLNVELIIFINNCVLVNVFSLLFYFVSEFDISLFAMFLSLLSLSVIESDEP